MTTKTDVAAEVEAIRERLALEALDNEDALRVCLERLYDFHPSLVKFNAPAIELWASLAADLAGLLQRQK